MTDIWKKWLTNPRQMRVAVALLYLLTSFDIPLSHTCQLADKSLHNCHSGCTSHLLHSDEHIEVQSVTGFNQNGLSETNKSHNMHCPVCLYSLTSKTFKLYSNTSLCSTQTAVRTQILPQLSFTKQLEWFCSNPLRAPPFSIS